MTTHGWTNKKKKVLKSTGQNKPLIDGPIKHKILKTRIDWKTNHLWVN